MLTMGKLYNTLKKFDGKMRMSKMEFFIYFIPDDLESAWVLEEKLEETASYRSIFFNGNTTRRGLNDKIDKILTELREDPNHFINEITVAATVFLESYGRDSDEDNFQTCLHEWKEDVKDEQILKRYIATREDNPDSYADILAVLYLYTMLLWRKETYLKFLTDRYQNGVSEEWNFDLERAEIYADCGKEKTIFQTDIVERHGVKWLDVKMNFAPTIFRKEIPNWASVVIKMRPPRDIRYFHSISFRIFPVAEETCENIDSKCGIEQLVVEIKPEDRDRIRHYAYPIDLKTGPQIVTIPLKNINPDILKQFEELCFVVNLNNLSGLESEDLKQLHGHFQISQIRLN